MENVLADLAPVRLRRPARLLRLTSDERLVALVRGGDEGAFEALYDRHHPAILGFCRHMLGSREEAEDAVQHTFLAAYRDLARHEQAIDLRPWLFAIARNRCLSLLRARRAQVSIELAEPTTDGLAATIERREDLRELLADLASLPEDQRAALLLAELGALDHAGIAAVLDCPREKVKALVFQARTSLAASREARATPCEDIRVELATASGAALRRGPLRRHLRTCDGCRAFKAEVATQRKLLALALPVVPSVALKASVLGGGGASSSGGGTAVAVTATGAPASGALGGALGSMASTGIGKLGVSLAIAGVVAGGGAVTAQLEHRGPAEAASAPTHAETTHAAPAPVSALVAPTRHGASRSRPVTNGSAPVSSAQTPHPQAVPTGANVAAPGADVAPPAVSPPTTGELQHRGSATPPGHGQAPWHRSQDRPPSNVPPDHGTTPPGQSRTPPGQSKSAPAQGKSPPGQSRTPPGQSKTPPGQSESHPGNGPPAGDPSEGKPSGQGPADGSPGNGAPPANTGSPGQSGASHGQSGAAHGHAG